MDSLVTSAKSRLIPGEGMTDRPGSDELLPVTAGAWFAGDDMTRLRKSAPSVIGSAPARVSGSLSLKDFSALTSADESVILQL